MSNLEQILEKTNSNSFLEVVHEFYTNMKAHEITLAYEGEITHQITKAFSSLAESSMSKDEEDSSVQKKVYFVMIECLQNISKHSDSSKADNSVFSGRGIFMVSKSMSEYAIITGNIIVNNKLEILRSQIEQVNSLNKEDLNDLYMKQLSEGQLSDKGGAGLGFIDIVRRTGRKLEYHFLELDEKFSFFILTTFVSRS